MPPGRFSDAEDLARQLLDRLAEIPADDETPWVKLGNVCFRAARMRNAPW